MTQPAKAQEPSMEEILASIRRIIADDDTKTPATGGRPGPQPPSQPPAMEQVRSREELAPAEQHSSDVLDLTEEMTTHATGRAEGFRTINGDSDVVFDDNPEESPPRARDHEPTPASEIRHRHAPLGEQALLSSFTTAAVDSAFNTLAHTVLVQN